MSNCPHCGHRGDAEVVRDTEKGELVSCSSCGQQFLLREWKLKYPCKRYGERMEDYLECGSCPEDICMACSLLTLEQAFGSHEREIDVITPQGTRVNISKGSIG